MPELHRLRVAVDGRPRLDAIWHNCQPTYDENSMQDASLATVLVACIAADQRAEFLSIEPYVSSDLTAASSNPSRCDSSQSSNTQQSLAEDHSA